MNTSTRGSYEVVSWEYHNVLEKQGKLDESKIGEGGGQGRVGSMGNYKIERRLK